MKILMLSIFAPHFFNWTEQLEDSGHQIFWFDIFDSNTRVKQLDFAEQIVGWRYRWDYPGRYFVKKNVPSLSRFINTFNERNFQEQLKKQMVRIQPDLVHSFVMYLGGVPALPVMTKFPEVKWLYSAWGSDMYYYQNDPAKLKGMKETFSRVNYMLADCHRDLKIAKKHGFNGEFLGVLPGGGGFNFEESDPYFQKYEDRKQILIKGYQGLHGKCISVLKAIQSIQEHLKDFHLLIFGADPEVFQYVEESPVKQWDNLEVKARIPFNEVMQEMGRSAIYIGNSSSDGTPNTLLEAIIMGAFPIQSNPGGATAELIEDGKNGFLIKDPVNSSTIAQLLQQAVVDTELRKSAVDWNWTHLRPRFERRTVREQVLKAYAKIEKDL